MQAVTCAHPNTDLADAYHALDGKVINIKPCQSGLTNQVDLLEYEDGRRYIVKRIDKHSERSRTLSAYQQIEQRLQQLTRLGLPVVHALANANGHYITELHQHYCLVFPYHDSVKQYAPVDIVSEQHAHHAGELLGQLHHQSQHYHLQTPTIDAVNFDTATNKLQQLHKQGLLQHKSWAAAIKPNWPVFTDINEHCLFASKQLATDTLFSHGDFMPHNLLWHSDGTASLIDWELAGPTNPTVELVMACIAFSNLNPASLRTFILGYINHYSIQNCQLHDGFYGALNKGWVNWIAFNMQRSLNKPVDQHTTTKIITTVTDALITLHQRSEEIINTIRAISTEIPPIAGRASNSLQ